MTAKVYSAAIIGLECQPVEVEVDLTVGLHCFNIVGLPDAAVNESKQRVSAAVKNVGAQPPHYNNRRVIVNLAPADLKKEGPAYDLPIALAFLLASEQANISTEDLAKNIFVGELSLEGKVRPINGALSIALMASQKGFETIFVPQENAAEAALVKNIKVIGLTSLEKLIDYLEGREILEPHPPLDIEKIYQTKFLGLDMAYVKGQEHVKRALEIAAAGQHNILMVGPPGTGKTLLAKTLPSILPPLSLKEALEVTKIFSITQGLSPKQFLITAPPFRQPHHTASSVALVGGGAHPKPGEITLAHHGVLFLDEFPEFQKNVLEALREPLEEGKITVSRASGSLNFPARFILVAAMNPCPCGQLNDSSRACICSAGQIMKYQRKISGPLLDRIDLYAEVPRIKYDKLSSEKVAEESQIIRQRIIAARAIQKKRFQGLPLTTNSEIGLKEIKKYCFLDKAGQEILKQAVHQLNLSARAYHRVLKLARTVADLDGAENILSQHIAEALQYRPQNIDKI